MSESLPEALILVSIDFMTGQSQLQTVIKSLQEMGAIQAISSVYKKFLNNRSEDLNSELVLVLKIGTKSLPGQIFLFLKKMERANLERAHAHLTLLAYGNQIRMMPGENLPSPLLHTDGLTLRCAAEVWGQYMHPVLGQTLNQLVRSNNSMPHVEFFAQGRSLLPSSEPL